MISKQYSAKISPQGQITIPKDLKNMLKVTNGSIVLIGLQSDDTLVVGGKYPIESYFGTLGNISGSTDAATFVREMRDSDNQYRDKKLGI